MRNHKYGETENRNRKFLMTPMALDIMKQLLCFFLGYCSIISRSHCFNPSNWLKSFYDFFLWLTDWVINTSVVDFKRSKQTYCDWFSCFVWNTMQHRSAISMINCLALLQLIAQRINKTWGIVLEWDFPS